jgi:ribonuclease HI
MKKVEIYTDGAAIPNPGMSGAGIVMLYGKYLKEHSIFLGHGTNNTAEVLAIIHALNLLKEPCEVIIYSDSQYAVMCGNCDWRRSSNIDLWRQFDDASETHQVTLKWIRKDSHKLNKKAHLLANKAVLIV